MSTLFAPGVLAGAAEPSVKTQCPSLSKRALQRLRQRGIGPKFCRIGVQVRYRQRDLDEWLSGRIAQSSAPEHCFWCSKTLADPTVGWHGSGVYLALHHGCAKEFGAPLICEAERFELITRGKSLLCGLYGGWDKISFAGSVPQ